MRLIKVLGLAAFAALAAMAFVSAPASADTLCHNTAIAHSGECPVANRVAVGANVAGLATGALLLDEAKKELLKCDSLALGKVLANEGAHKGLTALITVLNFTNCVGPCKKATGEKLPILLAVALTLAVNVLEDAGAGLPGATLEECSGLKCLYTINLPATLDLVEDLLVASQEPLTRGAACDLPVIFPKNGFWDAKYLLQLDVGGVHSGALLVVAKP